VRDVPVGVLLLIYTARDNGAGLSIRCNLSSWYVEPGFRNYAPMLSTVAQRHKHVQQDARAVDDLSEADVALLTRHAAYGCLSLVCRAADGRSFPFILQTMRPQRIAPRAMLLIYCADVADYVACAGVIGVSCSGAADSRSHSTPTAA
jgi:hypothetical protein